MQQNLIMLTLTGYQIFNQICESADSLVYRGIREEDNSGVIVKVLKQSYPTPEELTRYKLEYEITRHLNTREVIRVFSIEKYQNTLAIIFPELGDCSLKILLNKYDFHLEEFLRIAINITAELMQIHDFNIIHKDINPSNIVFNSNTKDVKIIDFGISTLL